MGSSAKPLTNGAPNYHRAYLRTLHFSNTCAGATTNLFTDRITRYHRTYRWPCDNSTNPVPQPSSNLKHPHHCFPNHWYPDFDESDLSASVRANYAANRSADSAPD